MLQQGEGAATLSDCASVHVTDSNQELESDVPQYLVSSEQAICHITAHQRVFLQHRDVFQEAGLLSFLDNISQTPYTLSVDVEIVVPCFSENLVDLLLPKPSSFITQDSVWRNWTYQDRK